ncbi:MAG: LacI family DNA-binding transcriptional regulator [Planctomycetaceae bacterium]|nr:LacI family DNA-binding transcriptional regulator [Planctomycetaceae bacterium]
MAKITITDLARRLGVSVCTVNKAINGKPKVSEKTRQRVLAEAERLGYRPNRSAQVLARNPVRLAYLHPDHLPSFFGQFEAGVREGVECLADQRVSTSLHALDPKKWGSCLLATGLFPEIRAAMEEDLVHFSLDQRMAEQGDLAVQQLHELLCQHPLPSTRILIPPRIAVRANIEVLAAKVNSTCIQGVEQE